MSLEHLTISTLFLLAGSVASTQTPSAKSPPAPSQAPTIRIPTRPTPLVSAQVGSDNRVTFRIYAPQSIAVSLAGDMSQGVIRDTSMQGNGAQILAAEIPMLFNDEMMKDIIPFMQSHFRVKNSPEDRALSGLSMGGIQTLNIGLHNLGSFRYLAIMSSGWTTDADRQYFYTTEASRIPTYNKQLKLFWWGWGITDIARANSLLVTEQFKKDGVHLETMETADGHEWKNWRLYLHEVAPKLFQQK